MRPLKEMQMDVHSILRIVAFLYMDLVYTVWKINASRWPTWYMLVNSFLHQGRIFFTCILLNLSGSSVRFLLLWHFRKVYLWLIGSKNSHIPLLCNADLFLLYFSGFIIVLTWAKYSTWDTFYTSTESQGKGVSFDIQPYAKKVCKQTYLSLCVLLECCTSGTILIISL